MKIHYILYVGLVLLLAACTADDGQGDEQTLPQKGKLTITSSVNSFEGEGMTRTNLAGDAFEVNDKIKLKMICPYAKSTMIGETTWGNSADGIWLLKWSGSKWIILSTTDSVDISSRYSYGYNEVFEQYEAQNTPYVYTASTWSENITFLAPNKATSNSGWTLTRYSQYSYIFHADQSKLANYKKSDLLWAQTYMQTGSYNVHLSFNHVMACLKITIPSSLSDDAIVTIEGMPDIDQKEVVVGDYYAQKAKDSSTYGYKDKLSCVYDNNGKVLGVAVINDETAKAQVYPMTGNPTDSHTQSTTIKNTGIYKAYNAGSHIYYLIVPPCVLPDAEKAQVWIRDNEKRYSYELPITTFEQGKRYPVEISLPTAP